MTTIFLGKPPANIEAWIKEHAQPAGHSDTRFTLQGGTVESYEITGTLDLDWMNNNGYHNEGTMSWTKIITQADIGNTVTSIGDWAFENCTSLTSITIPDSVTTIGTAVFTDCSSLKNITIPALITSISEGEFSGCSGLTSVTFKGKTLAQVQAMTNYPWAIEDTSIINVA